MAFQKALRLLAMKNYHSSLLIQKLLSKGFSREVCEQVAEECRRLGLLQDEEAILAELRKGYGPRAIAYKFRLELEDVREVITRDLQKARILEMFGKLGPRDKAVRTLQRRGFDLDLVIEILYQSQ